MMMFVFASLTAFFLQLATIRFSRHVTILDIKIRLDMPALTIPWRSVCIGGAVMTLIAFIRLLGVPL